jgi:hypothetical protein
MRRQQCRSADGDNKWESYAPGGLLDSVSAVAPAYFSNSRRRMISSLAWHDRKPRFERGGAEEISFFTM